MEAQQPARFEAEAELEVDSGSGDAKPELQYTGSRLLRGAPYLRSPTSAVFFGIHLQPAIQVSVCTLHLHAYLKRLGNSNLINRASRPP
jgi:hypothetical protein